MLDASFLIDYEAGHPAAAAFLQENADEEFVIPSTMYAEYLLGEANAAPKPDLPRVRAEIDWVQVRIPRKLRISASKPLHHFLPMHHTWTVLMQLLSVSLVKLAHQSSLATVTSPTERSVRT